MKKTLITHPAEYRVIPNTQYIVLPDQRIARLLTASVRPSGPHYNLRFKSKRKTYQVSLKAIEALIAGADPDSVENE
jgi:hypothetical protein